MHALMVQSKHVWMQILYIPYKLHIKYIGNMILKVIIDEKTIPIEVPDYMLVEAEEFFNKMDADMDTGWQMSRSWVDNPDSVQRCQIAADRILTSVHTENEKMATLMAAYILKKFPNIDSVDIDTEGDITQTIFSGL